MKAKIEKLLKIQIESLNELSKNGTQIMPKNFEIQKREMCSINEKMMNELFFVEYKFYFPFTQSIKILMFLWKLKAKKEDKESLPTNDVEKDEKKDGNTQKENEITGVVKFE